MVCRNIAISCAEKPGYSHGYCADGVLPDGNEHESQPLLSIIISRGFPEEVADQTIHHEQQRNTAHRQGNLAAPAAASRYRIRENHRSGIHQAPGKGTHTNQRQGNPCAASYISPFASQFHDATGGYYLRKYEPPESDATSPSNDTATARGATHPDACSACTVT